MIIFDHLNCRINELGIDPAKVNIHDGAIALGYRFGNADD